MSYALMLLCAGLLQGAMVSINAQLGLHFSLFGVSFFVHIIPAILLAFFIRCKLHERIFIRQKLPLFLFTVGFMGVAMIATSSYCTLLIGATATTGLSIIGQMFSSALIDHYGFFNVDKRRFTLRQLPAYFLVIAGIVLILTA